MTYFNYRDETLYAEGVPLDRIAAEVFMLALHALVAGVAAAIVAGSLVVALTVIAA